MLVERSCEETVHQLVIKDGFSYDSAHKFEVTQVIAVTVRQGIDGVGDAISGWHREQSIIGIEDLSGYNNIPFSQ